MNIVLNGEPREVGEDGTLLSLVRSLGLDPETVVAELNGKVVPGAAFETMTLNPEDRLELLRFVGGG